MNRYNNKYVLAIPVTHTSHNTMQHHINVMQLNTTQRIMFHHFHIPSHITRCFNHNQERQPQDFYGFKNERCFPGNLWVKQLVATCGLSRLNLPYQRAACLPVDQFSCFGISLKIHSQLSHSRHSFFINNDKIMPQISLKRPVMRLKLL